MSNRVLGLLGCSDWPAWGWSAVWPWSTLKSCCLVPPQSGGLPLTAGALRDRFDKAREAAGVPKAGFQFRDLRAKAGTDKTESAGDIRQAQKQLGHGSVTTTEKYVRRRKGDKAGPTR
ncbi:tyrosine-type recombinase/integrase [Achromobacter deleyi]|uniref:tyrosine-type recombinase/integrase n=1 Tax=Achromobacter deleyi TaxID=1353891 RepID=UPI001491FA0F|nr:tyrosine-type recombinase/integrase [Achromobacter deleyi]QVQ29162.1 tyrosine-type recombinase/integrase [Achromobacter deleyi]UIP19281.1 tyrosine-type recombinase/integrase [Achromobacter deleyi]